MGLPGIPQFISMPTPPFYYSATWDHTTALPSNAFYLLLPTTYLHLPACLCIFGPGTYVYADCYYRLVTRWTWVSTTPHAYQQRCALPSTYPHLPYATLPTTVWTGPPTTSCAALPGVPAVCRYLRRNYQPVQGTCRLPDYLAEPPYQHSAPAGGRLLVAIAKIHFAYLPTLVATMV